MKGQHRIDTMFAFVVVDPADDTEGITAFSSLAFGNMPMVGADQARVESLRPMAKEIAQKIGRPVEVIRFTNREHVEWIGD